MSAFRKFGNMHINLENVCYVIIDEDSADVIFTNGCEVTFCGKDKVELENTLLIRESYGKG
jgi:hypothetical protein